MVTPITRRQQENLTLRSSHESLEQPLLWSFFLSTRKPIRFVVELVFARRKTFPCDGTRSILSCKTLPLPRLSCERNKRFVIIRALRSHTPAGSPYKFSSKIGISRRKVFSSSSTSIPPIKLQSFTSHKRLLMRLRLKILTFIRYFCNTTSAEGAARSDGDVCNTPANIRA